MFVGYRNQIPRWRMMGLGMNPLGFLPTDIPGLLLWLTAETEFLFTDAPATIPVTADGDVVGAWEDRSGNNNDFSQATGAKKPEFKTSQINSKDVVRFDGIDNLLTAPNFSSALQGSLFITFELNAVLLTGQEIFSTVDVATDTQFVIFYALNTLGDPNIRIFQRNTDVGDSIRGDTDLVANVTNLAAWISDGSVYTLRVDGANEGLTVLAGANNGDWFGDADARDNFVIGAFKGSVEAEFLRGDIRQILLYDTGLAGNDLANVEAFLAADAGVILP